MQYSGNIQAPNASNFPLPKKCANSIHPIKCTKVCKVQFKTIFNPAPSTAAAATAEPVR